MKRRPLNCFFGIIETIKLFIRIKGKCQYIDHFQIFLQHIKFLYKQLNTLNHDILCQDHHHFVFKLSTDNHVSDGSWNEILVELFLVFLTDEESFEVLLLNGKFYPTVSIEHIRYIL